MKTYLFQNGNLESYEPDELTKTVHVKGESGENVLVSQEHFDTAEDFLAALQAAREKYEKEQDTALLVAAQKTVARKEKQAADIKAAQEAAAKAALAEQANKSLIQ